MKGNDVVIEKSRMHGDVYVVPTKVGIRIELPKKDGSTLMVFMIHEDARNLRTALNEMYADEDKAEGGGE